MTGNGQGGPAGLTEEQLRAFMQAQREATTRWVAEMAGCPEDVAERSLMQAAAQEAALQEFLQILIDPKHTAERPIMGVRIHHAGGKYTDYLCPKRLPKLVGGRWLADEHADRGSFMAMIGMLTSIVGRAIMAAQGKRIEFIQAAYPPSGKRLV
jgi:hypothetical protein